MVFKIFFSIPGYKCNKRAAGCMDRMRKLELFVALRDGALNLGNGYYWL